MQTIRLLGITGLALHLMTHTALCADALKAMSKKLIAGLPQQATSKKSAATLAVLNFPYAQNRSSTGSHFVSERLVTYLVQNGAVVVERRLLEKILEERRLWDTGLMPADMAQKIGNIVGADAVVTGFLSDTSETSTEVFARIVKIDSGEILSAAQTIIERLWRDLPRLPRPFQPRSAMPGVVIPLSASETPASPEARPRTGSRQRYYPSAVPYLPPSHSHAQTGGRPQ